MTPQGSSSEPDGEARIGPYTVRGTLGRGGMAEVFEVERDGEIRALKLLHGDRLGDEARRRFDAEYITLASLDHPNVLKVYDQGTHEGRPWFAMERVEGQDLRQEVESWRAHSPAERVAKTEGVLVQVAEALAFIHERGLVHRDITPTNIFVNPEGRVKLLDFGVVHLPGAELTTVGEMVGTVAWIAPEQISDEFNGGRVDARADLYSLGGVLYFMLTGRRPFTASTIPGLLDKHLHSKPRPPRELVPTVPHRLDNITMRLLEKEPAARFGSARHLLAALAHGETARVDLRAWPPRMVGRTSEKARLREAVGVLLANGRGGVILVEGPAGYGKSRLLRELGAQATSLGLKVASGRSTARDRAFGAFRGVMSTLAEGGALPPPLDRVFGAAEGGAEHWTILGAVRDLVRGAGPLVLLLDDLHEADRSTVELLEFLVRNHLHLSQDPVLFVLARRPPEGPDSLDGLLSGQATHVRTERLAMAPLGDTAVEEMLLQMIPDDHRTQALAQRLRREGEGNPHYIAEMIRGLAETGVIQALPQGGYALSLDETDVGRAMLPVPSSIRVALLERLAQLSHLARRAAELLATCDHELSLEVMLEVLGSHDHELVPALEELIDHAMARGRTAGLDDVYELNPGRLRDVLLENLEPEVRQRLHRRVGAAMERRYRHKLSAVVDSLAWHFEQGGLAAKAWIYLIRAGVRLLERSFVPEALDLFDRALALESDAREVLVLDDVDHQLAELRVSRGLALFHLGRWAEAEADYDAADELAVQIADERLRARTLTHRGTFARQQHRIDEAEALLQEALALAARLGDTALKVEPLHGLGAIRWTHGDLDQARQLWLEALAVGGATSSEEALGKGYNGLGLVAICRGQAAEARKYLEQSCAIFERLGKLGPMAVARINLVELYHCTGNLRKALQLADRTIAQTREIRYQYGVALGLRYRSMILVDLGRIAEAEENAAEARAILDELGSPEDALAAVVDEVRVALARGDIARAGELLDHTPLVSTDVDGEGHHAILHAFRARILAAGGDEAGVRAALAAADAPSGHAWPHQRCRVDINAARALATLGLVDAAAERAQEALRRADACGYRFYSLKAHHILATLPGDATRRALHSRVARALVRSLAASLAQEDAAAFNATFALDEEDGE